MPTYIAYEQVTIDNTAGGKGFTTSKINPTATGGASGSQCATSAFVRLETAEIRYTIDGTAPTTTVGTLLEIGDSLTINGPDNLLRFRAIRTGATSGVLNCTYTA